MLTALFLVLLILWLLGFVRPGNLDFLRAGIATAAGHSLTVLDVLVGIAIVWLIAAVPGPLAVAASVLLALWALSTLGVVAIEGVPLNALIVLTIMVGLMVHIVTRRHPA